MPKKQSKTNTAFETLVRVLEEAVQAGADSIGLEREGRDLIAFYYFGNLGIGGTRVPDELGSQVIKEVLVRARPFRKSKRRIPVTLLGRDYDAIVEKCQSFGEWELRISIKERPRKLRASGAAKKEGARKGAKTQMKTRRPRRG